MGIQLPCMPCVRPKVDHKDDSSPKSLESATSQGSSSIMSQSSLHSDHSLQSEFSLRSQQSIQSYNSLASVPSLGVSYPLDEAALTVNYSCVATLQGHDGHVFSVATAGNLLYSGSSGNEIRVWRRPELQDHGKFGRGDGPVKSIMLAGGKVYSAHQDHKIRVWQAQPCDHKLVATIPTAKDYLMTFALPNNYVQVRRHRKALWIEHVDTISVLAVDKKGFLYSGSWDRTVKIWRPSDFRCVESFRAHDDAINALVVSPEGFIYTGSADGLMRVWTRLKGEKKHSLVATLERHKSAINALALSPDGGVLYSGACDRSIIVWEREESAQHMTVAGALRGHSLAILCLAAVGNLLCSGSADKTVRLWRKGEGNSHSCLAVLEGHRGPVKSITASVDAVLGYLVYSGSLDRDIKVWWVSCSSADKRDDNGTKTSLMSVK